MDYLHECRRLHPLVTEIRFGKRQDLQKIEADAKEIRGRDGNRLTYEDLEIIRNSEIWDADQFGYWPSRPEIEKTLKSRNWKFRNLHRNREREKQMIKGLLGVFRQIEIVSVILRFIDPRRYGILSSPVEKVLGIGPSRDHTTKYLAYLENLEQLKSSYHFETAADVDMALWTLQLGVLEGRLKDRDDIGRSEYSALLDEYEHDQELKSIRMTNLAPQLFEDMPRLELARALLEAGNPQMAGQVAGCELERLVAKKADILPNEVRDLRGMIDNAWKDLPTRKKFKDLVEVRNDAVHRRDVTYGRVRALINTTETIGT